MSQKTQTYHWIQKVKKWKKKKEKKRDRIDERKHEWVKKGIKEKELEVKRGSKNRWEREWKKTYIQAKDQIIFSQYIQVFSLFWRQ